MREVTRILSDAVDLKQIAKNVFDVLEPLLGAEEIALHHANLHNHLRKGEPLNCPAELGLAGVVAVCMANESWRTGRMMAWDKKNEKVVPAETLPFNPYPEKGAG